ncbi:MAG TPA: DUF1801 domain-containing protein, partial [Mycobacterium sp.]|nr:DUF1801 domain-containing protein [Mycobacterium sp.]
GEAYRGGVAGDPSTDFLDGLTPGVRDIAERLISVVRSHRQFDVAIKWRQLTFAVDGDFDHWVCAVAATPRHARLTLHFGALLDDPAGVFEASDAQFVRKISYSSASEVDEAVVGDLLTQALYALPRFRAMRPGLAGPTRRRS